MPGSTLSKAIIASLAVLFSAGSAWADCDPLAATSDQPDRWVVSQDGQYVYDAKSNWTWMRCTYGMAFMRSPTAHGDDTCEGMPTLVSVVGRHTVDGDLYSVPVPTDYAGRGWAVPNQQQLASIIHPHCRFPVVDPKIFPHTQPNYYHAYLMYPDFVSGIHFGSGYVAHGAISKAYLRLVKPGKP